MFKIIVACPIDFLELDLKNIKLEQTKKRWKH